jgi:hypothetical protein
MFQLFHSFRWAYTEREPHLCFRAKKNRRPDIAVPMSVLTGTLEQVAKVGREGAICCSSLGGTRLEHWNTCHERAPDHRRPGAQASGDGGGVTRRWPRRSGWGARGDCRAIGGHPAGVARWEPSCPGGAVARRRVHRSAVHPRRGDRSPIGLRAGGEGMGSGCTLNPTRVTMGDGGPWRERSDLR